jgi:uncharacterized protein YbaP (TraB family)
MRNLVSAAKRLILGALVMVLPTSFAHAGHRIPAPNAHPALWTVHGRQGTAFLFGSIHVLPANINWKTQQLLSAMRHSDVFVFEIPLDRATEDREEAQRIQKDIMDVHGLLPPGQSLRGLLPAAQTSDYDLALAKLSISPGYIDRLQPWLAAMVLESAQLRQADEGAMTGVDVQVYAIASRMKKQTQGLETLEQQLAMVTPEEQSAGLDELDATVGEAVHGGEVGKYRALVDAWERGDLHTLDNIAVKGLSRNPSMKKALLDDRNARWALQLESMLEQPHTYFVTVGAAHLAGSSGVPALLRAAGYKVDGP